MAGLASHDFNTGDLKAVLSNENMGPMNHFGQQPFAQTANGDLFADLRRSHQLNEQAANVLGQVDSYLVELHEQDQRKAALQHRLQAYQKRRERRRALAMSDSRDVSTPSVQGRRNKRGRTPLASKLATLAKKEPENAPGLDGDE